MPGLSRLSRNRPWSGSPYGAANRRAGYRACAEGYQPHPQYAQPQEAQSAPWQQPVPVASAPQYAATQRPQQSMTLLRRRNTAAMAGAGCRTTLAAGADPSADAGLSAEPIAAEPSHMPPVIEQPVATEPEPVIEETRPAVLRFTILKRWRERAVSANNWRHGINRFRSAVKRTCRSNLRYLSRHPYRQWKR
ncbi:DNA translocase ftsK [Salmonella enterica subsp. enterica]|uniref:DNA translocase ftsK n=1 Tax=Salmonella enterica I TaxID=59201 RepID=A0A379WWF4_SALET|nr:DNA translocase ftsK [Salmonella enterica subsp. enterica]